jgi:hypothetical protein
MIELRKSKFVGAGMALVAMAGSVFAQRDRAENLAASYPEVVEPKEGISWPKGQALPIFARPSEALDLISVGDLSVAEQLLFSSLQGQVNRKQPRILLVQERPEEGRNTWAETDTVNFQIGKEYDGETKFDLLAKYAEEVKGVVLYDPEKSAHYRNLAGTVAGLQKILPVTQELLDRLKEHGIEFPVVADLTDLEMTEPVEIYNHLYDEYWERCNKRVILSARPGRRGDHHHTRDLMAATGAAVVWLDNRIPEERDVMRKFFGDMEAGNAIALGWYSSERSGITTASEFGIGTLPADFFVSSTVFSGTDHDIQIPSVPKMPKLEDKVYVALFVSDGDNIQYTQHAMRSLWDREADTRGEIPLTWTIAPGLVDIAPGIMNYYYQTATPNDCFATGPSGMGYLMPVNTLKEEGAPVGTYTKEKEDIAGYARLTETYLQRSGLRVMTVWDNATEIQRAAYEEQCRTLYGATVQNFRDMPSVKGSVVAERLSFEKLRVPYCASESHLKRDIRQGIADWDEDSPQFLSYQMNVWGELKPRKLVKIVRELEEEFGSRIEFVRGDHYFNLFNQATGIPYNAGLSSEVEIRTSASGSGSDLTMDGSPSTVWSAGGEKSWVGFDLGEPRQLSRYVVRHAGAAGMARELNTRDFKIEGSIDGQTWEVIDEVRGNEQNVTDREPGEHRVRYLKMTVSQGGADGRTRIGEVELFVK